MLNATPSDGDSPSYPRHLERLPEGTIESGRYRLRFARTASELDEILRLRFQVFNLEMGEGLDESFATRRDEDHFDACCHHLLVEEAKSRIVIGTYRMQTLEMARQGDGFYSAGEYDLSALPDEVLSSAVEVGRACILHDHRHRSVLFLLWKGLARYMAHNRLRYLFGCCSLTSQDANEGERLLRQLEAAGHVHAHIDVPVLDALATAPDEDPGDEVVEVPTLFKTYLRYGAKVVSRPAIDREFKTIDYLVLLDTAGLSERTRAVFFG